MPVGANYLHIFDDPVTPFDIMEKKIRKAQSRVKELGDVPLHMAWSGGKEALIVGHLIQQIRKINLASCEISWTFQRCIDNIKTYEYLIDCKVDYYDSVSVDWIRSHPEIIFSNDVKTRAMTYGIRQQRTIKKANPKGYVAVFGRRRPDNCVKDYLYETKAGVQFHPIFDWSFEDVKAYFRIYNIPVPWIYNTKFGQQMGTAPFYSLRSDTVGGIDKAWDIVASYDARYTRKNILGY